MIWDGLRLWEKQQKATPGQFQLNIWRTLPASSPRVHESCYSNSGWWHRHLVVSWLCAQCGVRFFFVFVLFLGFKLNWKTKTVQFPNTLSSINWNASRLPPLNGILQRFKRLWSTSEEVLHTVQSIHCCAWMQILEIVIWCHQLFGLMC